MKRKSQICSFVIIIFTSISNSSPLAAEGVNSAYVDRICGDVFAELCAFVWVRRVHALVWFNGHRNKAMHASEVVEISFCCDAFTDHINWAFIGDSFNRSQIYRVSQ